MVKIPAIMAAAALGALANIGGHDSFRPVNHPPRPRGRKTFKQNKRKAAKARKKK